MRVPAGTACLPRASIVPLVLTRLARLGCHELCRTWQRQVVGCMNMGNSTEWSHGAVGKTAPFASRGSSMLGLPLGGRSVGRSCTKPKSMSTWARGEGGPRLAASGGGRREV